MDIPDIYNLDHFNTNKMDRVYVECSNGTNIKLVYNTISENITTYHTGNLVNGMICFNLNLGAYAITPKSRIWMQTFKSIPDKMKSYVRKQLFEINNLYNGYLLLQFPINGGFHTFYIINRPSPLVDDIIFNIIKSVRIKDDNITFNSDQSYARFIILTNNEQYNPLLIPTNITKMTFIRVLQIHNMVYHIYKVNSDTIIMYLKHIIDDMTYNIISIKNNKLHHNKIYCDESIYFKFDGSTYNCELFNKYKYSWRFISLYNI